MQTLPISTGCPRRMIYCPSTADLFPILSRGLPRASSRGPAPPTPLPPGRGAHADVTARAPGFGIGRNRRHAGDVFVNSAARGPSLVYFRNAERSAGAPIASTLPRGWGVRRRDSDTPPFGTVVRAGLVPVSPVVHNPLPTLSVVVGRVPPASPRWRGHSALKDGAAIGP